MQQFLWRDDPIKICDRALNGIFTQSVADDRIKLALTEYDSGLARSYLELAAYRSVTVEQSLAQKVNRASEDDASVTH